MNNQTALKLAKKWASEGNYGPAQIGPGRTPTDWADMANRFLRALDAAQSCERVTGAPGSDGAATEKLYQFAYYTMLDVYSLPDYEGIFSLFFLDESNKRVIFVIFRRV